MYIEDISASNIYVDHSLNVLGNILYKDENDNQQDLLTKFIDLSNSFDTLRISLESQIAAKDANWVVSQLSGKNIQPSNVTTNTLTINSNGSLSTQYLNSYGFSGRLRERQVEIYDTQMGWYPGSGGYPGPQTGWVGRDLLWQVHDPNANPAFDD